jgi:hypothetical protein
VVITTFEAPSVLIGQNDWVSSPPATNPCGAGSLDAPYGAAAWDGSALLVPDTFSGRLLAFSPFPAAESDPAGMPSASWEIGEPGLTTCNGTSTLYLPQAPAVTGTKLVVADSGLNQVLVFAPIPATSGGAVPITAIGDGVAGCFDTSLSDPRGAVLAGIDLVVADTANNRVLVFEPDAHDLSKYVLKTFLGQQDTTQARAPTGCLANDDAGTGTPGTPTARTMNQPKAVWTDGTHLIVADSGNNRLLVWNTFPTVSGQAADAVVGQASFTTAATGAAAANELMDPESIAWDGAKLFVADTGNNRVVVFPSIPSTSTPDATIVLGQADFGCSFPNDAGAEATPGVFTCNYAAGMAPSQRTLNGPTGVSIVNGRLSITDTGNSRLVIFGK